jgi:hypothetical protein
MLDKEAKKKLPIFQSPTFTVWLTAFPQTGDKTFASQRANKSSAFLATINCLATHGR